MKFRRTSEDLRHPQRVLYQLVQEYSEGRLSKERMYYRAQVVDVGTTVGALESNPPSPANSIRARVYTYGLDANVPRDALTIFYPLFPDAILPQPNEHVYVFYEDENFSSGIWVTKIPNYDNTNLSVPEETVAEARTSADAFQGTNPRALATSQYDSPSITTQEQENTVRAFTGQENNIWQGKRVLIIGDSQCHGPPGQTLETALENNYNSIVHRDGRESWNTSNWLSGRTSARRSNKHAGAVLVDVDGFSHNLIESFSPDVIVIMLGGNDARRNQTTVREAVSTLWSQAQAGAPQQIWVGPPVAFPPDGSSTLQDGRNRVSGIISSVVGSLRFIDSSLSTNNPAGRRPDGVHFERNAEGGRIISRWVQQILQAGLNQELLR